MLRRPCQQWLRNHMSIMCPRCVDTALSIGNDHCLSLLRWQEAWVEQLSPLSIAIISSSPIQKTRLSSSSVALLAWIVWLMSSYFALPILGWSIGCKSLYLAVMSPAILSSSPAPLSIVSFLSTFTTYYTQRTRYPAHRETRAHPLHLCRQHPRRPSLPWAYSLGPSLCSPPTRPAPGIPSFPLPSSWWASTSEGKEIWVSRSCFGRWYGSEDGRWE